MVGQYLQLFTLDLELLPLLNIGRPIVAVKTTAIVFSCPRASPSVSV